MVRELGAVALAGYYDFQRVRIATMNRMRTVVRQKNEGLPLDLREAKKPDKNMERKYKDENLLELTAVMTKEGKLTPVEVAYLGKMLLVAEASRKVETRYVPLIRGYLQSEPIWTEYLRDVKGIGPRLGGNLVSLIDIKKATSPASLWKYAGLDVADGNAPRITPGVPITWSPRLRVVMWRVVSSMMRRKHPRYYTYYRAMKASEMAKHPLEQHMLTCTKMGSPGKNYKAHIDNRVRRRVAKLFLSDLFHAWKRIENGQSPRTLSAGRLRDFK